jgi:hypothetical protein
LFEIAAATAYKPTTLLFHWVYIVCKQQQEQQRCLQHDAQQHIECVLQYKSCCLAAVLQQQEPLLLRLMLHSVQLYQHCASVDVC